MFPVSSTPDNTFVSQSLLGCQDHPEDLQRQPGDPQSGAEASLRTRCGKHALTGKLVFSRTNCQTHRTEKQRADTETNDGQ